MAVLALAVPAFGFYQMPDVNGNAAIVRQTVESEASTGFNTVVATSQTPRPTCWGGCSWVTPTAPVVAEIRTGDATALSFGKISVDRQENGCCDEEGCANPCRRFCGPQMTQRGEIDVNLVLADQRVSSSATTGFNTARARVGSAKITTGNAMSQSTADVLVGVQVNDLN